jgi:hypothetical protein
MDLGTIRATVLSLIAEDSFLFNGGVFPIVGLSEDIGDAETNLLLAQYKASGIMILVHTLVGHNDKPNVKPPQMSPKLVCTVMENVTVNRGVSTSGSQQSADKVAEHLATLLHQNLAFGGTLPLWTDILTNQRYVPTQARDVVFQLPWASLSLQTR